jgi:hypothetical protein
MYEKMRFELFSIIVVYLGIHTLAFVAVLPTKHSDSSFQSQIRTLHLLNMSSGTDTPPLPSTDDPYAILNIKPTSDSREIKRAYKRMALKYHPDVRTNSGSSSDERKQANDEFARINAAYSVLTGKAEGVPKSNSSSRTSSTDAYSSYSAPHRRKSANYGRSSFSDWKDYIPKYDEEEYDAGGDSFTSILTDLLAQVGSSSSGSVLNDFISFLEGNFPSVGSKKNVEEDLILDSLLSRGDIDEIKLELDEAKLLVKQLEIKEMDLAAEIKTIEEKQAKETVTKRSYMDEMRLDENKREVEARKEVVGDYLLRAKVRQMKLRKRYDELKQNKVDDRSRNNATSVNNAYTTSPVGEQSTARSYETNSQQNTGEQESWRTQGFGSGRRRGRSRSDRSSNEYRTSSNQVSTPRSNEKTSDQNIGSYSTRSDTLTSNVPPHRRIASSFKQQAEDKRRLREIKVDEEIDKMKKELGL